MSATLGRSASTRSPGSSPPWARCWPWPWPVDGTPEISWGDRFFSYAPDGVIPQTQPFATIVTKDDPDEALSRLDRPDAFRVNVAAGQHTLRGVDQPR